VPPAPGAELDVTAAPPQVQDALAPPRVPVIESPLPPEAEATPPAQVESPAPAAEVSAAQVAEAAPLQAAELPPMQVAEPPIAPAVEPVLARPTPPPPAPAVARPTPRPPAPPLKFGLAAADIAAVADAATEEERARQLVEGYLDELQRHLPPRRAGRLHYECARLLESPLGEMNQAAEHYQKAHQLIPEHVPTLRGARRTLIATGNREAALLLFDAEVTLTADPVRKALLLYEKGCVLDQHAIGRKQAQAAFASACALDKSNPTLLKAAALSEFKSEAWEPLQHVYERTANAVKADARHRAAVTSHRARLVEVRRQDSALATELYQNALQLDPRAPGALHALKHLHYVHGRWGDLVAVLEQEAEQASEPAVKALAHYRAARIQIDRLGNLEEGLAALERAAGQTPDDLIVLEELANLYEAARRYDGLARVLQRLAQRSSTIEPRVTYLHRIGQIYERQLGDEQTAVRWYEQVLRLAPTHSPTVQALTPLYTRRQQWDALCTMLFNQAEGMAGNDQRAAAHARIAEIQEVRLGNLDQAVEHHSRALALVPGHPPSFKALVRLHTEAGRFHQLAELYERAVEEAGDAETKFTFLFKIGRIYEDALGAPEHAVHAYQRILRLDPQRLDALHGLQRAAERAQDWKELVAALRKEGELTHDVRRQAALLHRAGEVLDDKLGEHDAAVEQYQWIVKQLPDYTPAIVSLGELFHRLGRWDELLDNYRQELKATSPGPAAAAVLHKMGELSEERLAREEDAGAFYHEAVETDRTHVPSRRALARKYSERGEWRQLVQLLEFELADLEDAQQRARTACRIGELYEYRLNEPARALTAYEHAVGADPGFRPAWDGRTRLLEQARKWPKLAESLAQEAASATDSVIAIAASLREGEIRRDELADAPRAIKAFEAVLERDPTHLGALLALEPLYAARGSWEELARVLATQVQVLSDPGAKIAVLHQLAQLQVDKKLASVDQVKQIYFSILQLAPHDLMTLSALERLSIAQGDRQLLAHMDARLGTLIEDATVSAAHSTRLGEILESAGDMSSALKAYRAALHRDVENLAAARGLSRLAQRVADPALLDEAATWESRVTGDHSAAARLLVKASSQLLQKGEQDGATDLLERALGFDPDLQTAADRLCELLTARGDIDRLLTALSNAAQSAKSPARQSALWMRVAEIQSEQGGNLGAGMAALRRITSQQPGNVPALMKLADLYTQDAQWQQAAECLNQVATQASGQEVAIEASLRLASILDQQLGDPVRARRTLESVLARDQNNPAALRGLLHYQVRQGEHDTAGAVAAKLISVATGPRDRADALTQLAHVERARGKISAAVEACEQAVALVGMQGEAAAEFRAALPEMRARGDLSGPQRYLAALTQYLERASDAPTALAQALLEAARLTYQELRQIEPAISMLRRGLELDPTLADLHVELAGRLKETGGLAEALQHLRLVLEVDVAQPQIWRDIAEVFAGMQRPAESQLALAGLVAIGLASDAERAAVATWPNRYAVVQAGALGRAELDVIGPASRGDFTAALLGAAAEGVGKLYLPDLNRHGVSARDRIGPRSSHTLRVVADRIGGILDAGEFGLYVQTAHTGATTFELTDPPSLILPAYVLNLPEPQQVFLIGRALALFARRLHPIEVLSLEELDALLAAAARHAAPDFGAGKADESMLNDYSKRLHKSLSRRNRRALEDAAGPYAAGAAPRLADWVASVRIGAARVGLLLADDLPSTITLVRQLEGDLSGLQGEALAFGIAEMNDLVRFWVSEEAFAVRQRLGML
jgi:tetratricopeptide (TPR) repeat protein